MGTKSWLRQLASLAGATYCAVSWAGMLGLGMNGSGSVDTAPAATETAKALKARATTDVSDLWWNPGESGWGMQLVQNNDFVFATLYVYGNDGKPTWFTAQLNDIGNFTWNGPLYVTAGPSFAGPFNPAQVSIRQAGSMTFHASSIAAGVVTYSVDGVTVSKNVSRETLVYESLSGVYDVIGTQTQVCNYPFSSGKFTGPATLSISHSGSTISGQTATPSGTCALVGTYFQDGKMGAAAGSYSCTWGEQGTFKIFETVITETGVLLRFLEQSNLCSSISGQFAGNRR